MAVAHGRSAASQQRIPGYRANLLPIAAFGLVMLFLAAPWPLEHKAHLALHGLCAQRPSHSLRLGGRILPFDARMTGIYGGFLGAAVYLCLRRRYRVARLPPWPALGVLALFVGAMAVDGVNSTLVDLQTWHPYEPANGLRLLTGLMTGIALAVAICFLIGTTVWRCPEVGCRVVGGVWEVGLLLALQAPFALLARSGVGWLYGPVALALLLSAVAVVATLMLIVVILLRNADNSFESLAQLQSMAVLALMLGLVVIAGIGGGRFLLERLSGAPPLT